MKIHLNRVVTSILSAIKKKLRIDYLIVFVISFCVLFFLRLWFQEDRYQEIYFQEWSSEFMMQTVSIFDLRDEPMQSIMFLHIQPPLLDSIRLFFAQIYQDAPDDKLLLNVDKGLYTVLLLAYSSMGLLLYKWFVDLSLEKGTAFIFAIIFLIHPAAIFYANFLEGTLFTTVGVLWLCYGLWKVQRKGSILWVITAFLFLFFVRSIFQWHALIVLTISLVLLKVPKRKILTFTFVCGTVIGVFLLKQYLIFGLASTSSFAGSSCLHSLGIFPFMEFSETSYLSPGPLFPDQPHSNLPKVITRVEKMAGAHNYNNIANLINEKLLLQDCIEIIRTQPLLLTVASYLHNTLIFFQPSSNYYTSHIIADRLPWRSIYNFFFSGLPLVTSIVLAACAPRGIRILVLALRGPRPGPLDDGGVFWNGQNSNTGHFACQ
jgi:hypothetical protein